MHTEDSCSAEVQAAAPSRRIHPATVHAFVEGFVAEDLHARRVFSLAHGVGGTVRVTSATGVARKAEQWLRPDGRLLTLRGAGVTADETPVDQIVVVRAHGMKEGWYLASSRNDLSGAKIKNLYGRRFTIEENFRDTKDAHFGLGLSSTHVSTPARRDHLC